MKVAIITGITGQDGAYLAKFLLGNGYKVIGTYRRTSSVNFWRLDYLNITHRDNMELVEYDLTDSGSAIRLIDKYRPDEIYNLAAQSFVGVSFDQPVTTAQITGIGPVNLLEAIRVIDHKIRFYQASTSEMFGLVQQVPQTEKTAFYPRSPYGAAKLYAHSMVVNYREAYDIFACSGILFNHESPLRGKEFVTRKITDGVARIKLGKQDRLELGNIDAKRDWGYADDYVQGMHAMLQHDVADTFVLATNRTLSVRDFVTMSFAAANIDLDWQGTGVDEFALDRSTGVKRVSINPDFYRPSEVDLLIGDASKADKLLNWRPTTDLEKLCLLMVEADMKRVGAEKIN
ncbi:GDP-mannose 4,6-dehydratase [Sphingorhabdus sp. EL138]|uniref:GDP-mannose 4,6-dehydratase n=1 Tax=Sphingorhabdus sp. EL138 TaxID=2073156 RepID=UPI000D6969FB|nr:GDP-mannose 4,6-dehydratase [Sphingorhabdus sp. EL138]